MASGESQGWVAADMALDILGGASVKSLPLVTQSPNVYMFDYAQMKRFGISEGSLPAGSTVINAEVSVFETYGREIAFGLVLFIAVSGALWLWTLKRAEERIARFGHIIDQSLNEIYVFDAHTLKFMQANFGARNNLGYSENEIRKLTPLDIKPEFTAEQFEDLIAPLRNEESKSISFNTVHRRKNGTHYNVEVHLQYLHAQKPPVFVAVVQDISERLRMIDALVQGEKMTSVTSLAAGMAHELNNPLGAIVQNAQNVRRRLSSDLPKNKDVANETGIDLEALSIYLHKRHVDDLFDGITESCERASGIIKQLVNLRPHLDQEKTPTAINGVVDDAIAMAAIDYDLKHDYRFTEIKIVRDFNRELPDVICREGDIKEAVLSILRNAAQAMADRTQSPKITIRTGLDGDRAFIEIADNGPGMEHAIMERIFDPMFTTHSPKRKGLGLSSTYSIVCDHHGGRLKVDSSPGNGAMFRIELPLTQA